METTLSRVRGVVPALLLAFLVGCGSSGSAPQVLRSANTYDANAIVDAAFQKYDTNHSGTLEANELAASPSLRHFAGKKATVTRSQLQERVTSYTARGADTAVINVGAAVRLKGEPLVGATVTLTPESFMGSGFSALTGTTNEVGYVEFANENGRGIPAGFYTITISKPNASGKETLAPRYNVATQEGREISAGPRGADTLEINLAG